MSITKAQALDGFRLSLAFSDGVTGVVDLSRHAGRGVFRAWQQPGFFDRVSVTDDGAVEWPGGLDLCPDALYLEVTGQKPEQVFPGLGGALAHA
jgi:hypothetical protein